MNDRIRGLRRESLESVNSFDCERAMLITRFYRDEVNTDDPVPVQRARAFSYLLENKHVEVFGDELIVGERGPSPKAVPAYPEVTLHSLEDLDILDSREKVSYKVSPECRKNYEDFVIPFWEGKSQRHRIMSHMTKNWLDAYEAGVFTEFQEQRTPGHTVAGKKMYRSGLMGFFDPSLAEEEETADLRAMKIAAEAMVRFAGRYSRELARLALEESREWRRKELLEMSEICKQIPGRAPRSFHEALQYYWFVHLGVIIESNPWDSFNPGRLDQHLYPFYKGDVETGKLTKERAVELLQSFWIKFNNHPAPPKVGVTALESNTYTDFALINLGGLDEAGHDAVNELSYILLDVIEEMRLLQPSSMVQVSRENPDRFIERALKIIQTGFGQPSVFNTDMIIQELIRQGKDIVDARNGGASGCVESGAFGTEAYILTGYFNLTKVLEISLHNGFDPVTGKTVGLATGKISSLDSYDKLLEAYKKQLEYFLNIKMGGNRVIEQLFSEHIPVPFLSLIIDDCVENQTDYNSGGARYNSSYIQGVGLGTISDSLAAIKYHVFDKKNISFTHLLKVLSNNFQDEEQLHYELIYNSPKYGNDDDYADERAREVFEMFFEIVDNRPAWRPGAKFRINMLPTTSHVYFGSVLQATPDGRKAGLPLSEGISPVQGRDSQGPTAAIRSASKIDHAKTGGTLLNQKFSPSFFEGKDAYKKLTALIRTYFRLGGHHIQFNVVSAEVLRQAQKNPEDFNDLIVRVAGYSDYFNHLGRDLQDEIIRRTENNA